MVNDAYISKRLEGILEAMDAVKEAIAELKTDIKDGRAKVLKKDRPGLTMDERNWNRAAELDWEDRKARSREDWMRGKKVGKNSYHEIDELTDRDRPVDLANREVEDDGFITLDDDLTHRRTDN
jgi:hypothetical protein